MRLPADLQPATFIRRLNRFLALVQVDGKDALAHVANSGRLRELFVEGRPVLLAPRAGDARKTSWDLLLVRLPGGWVSADARLPPSLAVEALRRGRLLPFLGYPSVQREVPYGHSRLDLALKGSGPDCVIEVKSATLVNKGCALFPDAPTERGTRHMGTLARARRAGLRAAVLFVVQRQDAHAFAPHDAADPEFGRALRRAARAGVEVYAYRCRVTPRAVTIAEQVPVRL